MSKLEWDTTGERFYETGVDRGILFPFKKGKYQPGVAWSGITAVNENPSGAEDNALYADNIKYLNIKSVEEFAGGIECYTYPDEWAACDGSAELAPGVSISQQKREMFGLSYRTKIGNDEDDDLGYKIHLVYGCSASVSQKDHQTVNENPEAMTFNYEFTTTPVKVEGFRPTAHLTVDTTKVDKTALEAFEKKLYGSEDGESTLLMPDEVAKIFAQG